MEYKKNKQMANYWLFSVYLSFALLYVLIIYQLYFQRLNKLFVICFIALIINWNNFLECADYLIYMLY